MYIDCCLTECVPLENRAGEYEVADLCSNEFQSDEVKAPSVSELSGGFGRTKYVMMMAGGLVYTHLLAKNKDKKKVEGAAADPVAVGESAINGGRDENR